MQNILIINGSPRKNGNISKMLEAIKEEAEKLRATIEVPDHGKVSVPFWTAYQFSELIGVAYFSKDKNGEVVYELDFSETTL